VAKGDGLRYGDVIYGCDLSIEITVAALVVVPLLVGCSFVKCPFRISHDKL
jgi:hypothetical protein